MQQQWRVLKWLYDSTTYSKRVPFLYLRNCDSAILACCLDASWNTLFGVLIRICSETRSKTHETIRVNHVNSREIQLKSHFIRIYKQSIFSSFVSVKRSCLASSFLSKKIARIHFQTAILSMHDLLEITDKISIICICDSMNCWKDQFALMAVYHCRRIND